MKRIIVAGAGGYLGGSFLRYLADKPERYETLPITTHDGSWRAMDLRGADAVYFAAGLAHQKETAENAAMYQAVNCNLAVEFARKAKEAGVRQFVYLSSMSVYGLDVGAVTAQTLPAPKSNYGRSKLAAEEALTALGCDTFAVAILRPPMVYGRGCKGNYRTLSALSRKLPVFPKVDNRRSMLYVDNLSEFVRQIIDDGAAGLFFPQERDYVNTSRLASEIAAAHGKRIVLLPGFGWLLRLLSLITPKVNKAFGSLTYEQTMSELSADYRVVGFSEGVRRTES